MLWFVAVLFAQIHNILILSGSAASYVSNHTQTALVNHFSKLNTQNASTELIAGHGDTEKFYLFPEASFCFPVKRMWHGIWLFSPWMLNFVPSGQILVLCVTPFQIQGPELTNGLLPVCRLDIFLSSFTRHESRCANWGTAPRNQWDPGFYSPRAERFKSEKNSSTRLTHLVLLVWPTPIFDHHTWWLFLVVRSENFHGGWGSQKWINARISSVRCPRLRSAVLMRRGFGNNSVNRAFCHFINAKNLKTYSHSLINAKLSESTLHPSRRWTGKLFVKKCSCRIRKEKPPLPPKKLTNNSLQKENTRRTVSFR